MQCDERERLWGEFSEAVAELFRRTNELAVLVGDTRLFQEKALECGSAKLKLEATQAAWISHVQEHGCDQVGESAHA
jgi:hypothetical protein